MVRLGNWAVEAQHALLFEPREPLDPAKKPTALRRGFPNTSAPLSVQRGQRWFDILAQRREVPDALAELKIAGLLSQGNSRHLSDKIDSLLVDLAGLDLPPVSWPLSAADGREMKKLIRRVAKMRGRLERIVNENVDPEAGAGGEARLPAVRMGDGADSREVWVFGRSKDAVTKREAAFLRALLDIFPKRIKGERLETTARKSDSSHVLSKLSRLDPDWKAAILLAGASYGGYGIASMTADPQQKAKKKPRRPK